MLVDTRSFCGVGGRSAECAGIVLLCGRSRCSVGGGVCVLLLGEAAGGRVGVEASEPMSGVDMVDIFPVLMSEWCREWELLA